MPLKDRKLTQVQIALLLCLYKFRFGTSSLLAVSTNKKDDKFISPRLKALVEKGYLGRNYDKSYIRIAKPASYYLLPKALRALKEASRPDGLTDQAIKASYKDKQASKPFIDRSLNLYGAYNVLIGIYGGLQLFLKRELADEAYNYFPRPLPDGFLSLNAKDKASYFFMEYIEAGTALGKLNYLFSKYVTYYEDDTWAVTELPFPVILCIAEDGRTERVVQRQIARVLNRSSTDLQFYTTTLQAVLDSSKKDDAIWSNIVDPDRLVSLEYI